MLLRQEDVEMRTDFDFSPLFRTTVGFDRMLDALRGAMRTEHPDGFPPYDIERLGEDRYRITLAVAGFAPEELSVTAHPNLLVVTGERHAPGEEQAYRQVLHRGIAARAFERRFELADHVRVTEARLQDGLLTIMLERDLPEAMRPRRIEIGQGGLHGGTAWPQIEGHAEEQRSAA
jgi:molecular chaperone IbpA